MTLFLQLESEISHLMGSVKFSALVNDGDKLFI